MKHKKLVREVGNWVVGERFYDREYELTRLQSLLREGASVSLIAQRRVGKTSLMRETARTLQGEFDCVFLDVQACSSPSDFFAELLRVVWPSVPLRGRVSEALSKFIESVETLEISEITFEIRKALRSSWSEKADRIINGLLKKQSKPVVLFVDELPILVHKMLSDQARKITPVGVSQTAEFLSWLRRTILEHKGHISVVIAGSIGLEPLLHRVRLSATINAFHPFELGPWDAATAHSCMLALARNYDLQFLHGAHEHAVSLLRAPVPHHIQLFFDYILDHAMRGQLQAVFPKDVEEVYRVRMLGHRGQAAVLHYIERLRDVLDDTQLDNAHQLLDAIAKRKAVPLAEVRMKACSAVLDLLVHDGYIERHNETFRFTSNYVGDLWRLKMTSEGPCDR